MDHNTLHEVLDYHWQTRHVLRTVPYIESVPGIGKTEGILAWATARSIRPIVTLVQTQTPNDLVAYKFGDSDYLESAYNIGVPWEDIVGDENIAWFLDEFCLGLQIVQNTYLKLIHEHRIGDKKLGKNVMIVMAGNSIKHRAGSNLLSTPMSNRVTHYTMNLNNECVCDYFAKKYGDLATTMLAYLSVFPLMEDEFEKELKRSSVEGSNAVWASPRSMERALVRYLFAVKNNRTVPVEYYKSDIGLGRAIAFSGFLKLQAELPTYEKILENPQSTPMPIEHERKFAMIAMLVQKTTRANFPKLALFVQRMDVTQQILYLKMVQIKDPTIQHAVGFKEWIMVEEIRDAFRTYNV